jgi:hypothetical protein
MHTVGKLQLEVGGSAADAHSVKMLAI